MENSSSNDTLDSGTTGPCDSGLANLVRLSLMDIVPLVFGQPVINKLLWISFTSEKGTDILNFNLALFHSLQYLMAITHFIFLFVLPNVQMRLLMFMLVYAQIGGPMSLCFICFERYVAVVHPTSYPLLKKYRFREVSAVTVWLFSLAIASVNISSLVALSSMREQVMNLLPFFLLVVMSLMIFRSTVIIARTLKKSSPGRNKLHPVKKRAFKTICATSIITLCFYTPVTIMQRFMLVDGFTYNCIFIPVSMFLLSAASVVHPLFYLYTQGKLFTLSKKSKE